MKPNKRKPRTKSSKRFCEEKLNCPLLNSEAKYFCDDCKTAQCQACEAEIHSTNVTYDFHVRRPIIPVEETSLCQSKKLDIVCSKDSCVNYPDLWCENCKIQLCYTCYDLYHNTNEKRKKHRNVSINYHNKKLSEQGLNQVPELQELERSSEFFQDAMSDGMIKPIVPYSSPGDNSLTFHSFPQESDETRHNAAFTSSSCSFHSIENMETIPQSSQRTNLTEMMDRARLEDSIYDEAVRSFQLVDDQEQLMVRTQDEFVDNLGCDRHDNLKVVSIFGNTGDGKSHTLNHLFFGGYEIFKTSPHQSSCTCGVWCALDKQFKTVVLDTEGLLGSTANENQRTRLLIKILAVSDVVIYRTRAERLHNDMCVFLSNASKAYCKHFAQELKLASQRCGVPMSNLGPTLIVFQETTRTNVIEDSPEKSAAGQIRDMFVTSKNPIDAFRNVCYVGIRTENSQSNFSSLRDCVIEQLRDNTVRTARKPEIVFQSLKALNDKFSEAIEAPQLNTFPDQYFTCTSRCQACKARCTLSMNHDTEAEPHDAGRNVRCQYQSEFGNKVFMCKACLRNKEEVIVVPKTSSTSDSTWMGFTKYIWSGYVYECRNCGIIFRSREHWYGNEDEEKVLHVEFRHVWPQGHSTLDGTHNAARKVIDGFHYLADTISSVSSGPTKVLTEWTADQINPAYWVPNAQIIKCKGCELLFTCSEQKHHCRACGKGFCADCSTKRKPVPERGWGSDPVRVCDSCYANGEKNLSDSASSEETALTARKVGEAVSTTISVVASALDYPLGFIKNTARPAYWVPDEEIKDCCVCKKPFGPRLSIHHCRACGKGVCDGCSPSKRVVAFRGWDYPVRVCNNCEKKTDKI